MRHEAELSPLSRGIVLTALAGAAVAGCTSLENTGTPPSDQTSEISAFERYAAMPQGACGLYGAEGRENAQLRDTEACLGALGGRLVIVSFTNIAETTRLADETERLLPILTDGAVHPEVDAVEASPKAQAAFEAAQADGCSPLSGPLDFASFAAADTMPELSKYDGVVAEHDEQICGPSDTSGAADLLAYRLADVESEAADGRDYTEQERVGSTIHEILHLYGLGHAGSLRAVVPPNTIPDTLEGNGITIQSGQLDLESYVRSVPQGVEEYGDYASIMSFQLNTPPEDKELSPIHLAALTKPESLANGTALRMTDATEQPATVEASDNDPVVSVTLAQPIDLVTTLPDGLQEAHTYSGLAIVPITRRGDAITAVEVALIDGKNNYATLGGLTDPRDQGGVFDIVCAGNTIQLNLNDDQLTVSNSPS